MQPEYPEYESDSTPPGEDEEAGYDPYAVDPVVLPSGVKVEFRPITALSSNDVRWLRGPKMEDGTMAFYNELSARAVHLLVESWTLATAGGEPVLTPRQCRPGTERTYLRVMGGIDLVRLERHLRPALDMLLGEDKASIQGE